MSNLRLLDEIYEIPVVELKKDLSIVKEQFIEDLFLMNDEDRMEFFYKNYKKYIFKVSLKFYRSDNYTYNESDAENLMQETFIKLWHCFNSFRGSSKKELDSYIYTLIKNAFYKLKYTSNKKNIVISDSRYVDNIVNFSYSYKKNNKVSCDLENISKNILEEDDAKIDIDMMLNDITKRYKAILYLHDIEGYSFEKIAEMLKVTIGSIKSNRNKAIKKIIKQFIKIA